MKTISPMTTAGHSTFQGLILMISLYFGLAMIAHQNPELTRPRTYSMTKPASATFDDDNKYTPKVNETINKNPTKQHFADTEQEVNPSKFKKKKQQFPNPRNENRSRNTADDKWCTIINEGKIQDKKKELKFNSFTPVVVIQVEKFEDPHGSSILIKSHGAAELYETVHPRPWDVWLRQSTNQNYCKESIVQPVKETNNNSPRDTPATERQTSVAKWMVQRKGRDTFVSVPPSRFLSGLMLFRPWDRWKQHVFQHQKTGGRYKKEGISWPRMRPRDKLRIIQNATGDESEAGPPSSQQGYMNEELVRKGSIRLHL